MSSNIKKLKIADQLHYFSKVNDYDISIIRVQYGNMGTHTYIHTYIYKDVQGVTFWSTISTAREKIASMINQ